MSPTKRLRRLGAALAIAGGAAAFWQQSVGAGTATANLSVTATVITNCTISTATLAFGNYDPVITHASASLDGTGTVTIACTKGSTTPIDLGLGNNASGSTRRMASGSNYLTYELYQDSGRTTVWGTGAAGLTPAAAPSKVARDFTVYGRIPGAQDLPAGSYSDSVNATVNF